MEEFCLKKSIFYVDFFLVLFEPVNGYVIRLWLNNPRKGRVSYLYEAGTSLPHIHP